MILAFDLGTGGVKVSLLEENGTAVQSRFQSYPTHYSHGGRCEQRPLDWWNAVCQTARSLLQTTNDIRGIALSGFSMTAVPLDAAGNVMTEWTPIWSDTRATAEAQAFFTDMDREEWYRLTGNGDPPELYPAMKLMWLREHQPRVWRGMAKVLGSKDYINYRLTGEMATDHSYASGSGLYDLRAQSYSAKLMDAAQLNRNLFPDLLESHERIGRVTPQAALETGLKPGTPVFCGGVDNAMMALGTTGARQCVPYTSLGSSAWIAVTSDTPVLDEKSRPFVFAFAKKGQYTSGVSIFAAGSALLWAAKLLLSDCDEEERMGLVNRLAEESVPGANGVLFNPALAGASPQEPQSGLGGAFRGLSMATGREDLLRSVMEGVTLSLSECCLRVLRRFVPFGDTMLLTGGGCKSDLWMRIFANVYGMNVLRSRSGQGAAARGAAMAALYGLGTVSGYEDFDQLLFEGDTIAPQAAEQMKYEPVKNEFAQWIRGGESPV